MNFNDVLEKLRDVFKENKMSEEKQRIIFDYLNMQENLQSENITDFQVKILVEDLEKLSEEKEIRGFIDQWVKDEFETEEKCLANVHGREKSLKELIEEGNPAWETGWGASSDFQYVLEIGLEKQYGDTCFTICNPKVLLSGEAAENDGLDFFDLLQREHREKYVNEKTLLIPLNLGNWHWVLGKISIKQGIIMRGELFDPLCGDGKSRDKFFEILGRLSVDRGNISLDSRNAQHDSFRCFDYVCQEILRSISDDHDEKSMILQAKDGLELRAAIRDQIDKKLRGELPEIVAPGTPVRSDGIIISACLSPDTQAAWQAFVDKLVKEYPEMESAKTIIMDRTSSGRVLFSPSFVDASSLSASAAAPPFRTDDSIFSPSRSTEMDNSLHQSLSPSIISVSEARLPIEKKFMTHYDDSSDEEDGVLEISKDNLKQLFANTKDVYAEKKDESEQDKKNRQAEKISFFLFTLGRLILRSSAVKPYYRYLKEMNQPLDEASFHHFKAAVTEAFQKQFGWDDAATRTFCQQIWPVFLAEFRKASKQHSKELREVLSIALKATLKNYKLTDASDRDLDVISSPLIKDIEKSMPKRVVPKSVSIQFGGDQKNVDYQLAASSLLLYRLTRRHFKETDEKATMTIQQIIQGRELEIDVTLDSKNRTDFLRGGVGTYSSVLDPVAAAAAVGKKYKGHSASIKKYKDKKKTDQEIVHDMQSCVNGSLRVTFAGATEAEKNSYCAFLIKLYCLLQQVEVGRNPAMLLINVMLMKLIMEYKFTWNDVFPANDSQKEMKAKDHPPLLYPMALKGAPDAAVFLNTRFNKFLPFSLRQAAARSESRDADECRIIMAKKQYAIVQMFFERHVKEPLETATDDKIIEVLSNLATSYNGVKSLQIT